MQVSFVLRPKAQLARRNFGGLARRNFGGLARRNFGGLARRQCGGLWDSSKGRIFRIKATPARAAARVAVCNATTRWNPLPSVLSGRSEGHLQLRSRCGLEKSVMPSQRFSPVPVQG
jgi:hypothetical protein